MVAWMAGIITPASWMIFSTEPWWWVAVYLLCALQIGVLGRKVGSFHPLAALLYPIPLIFFFIVFACSAFKSGKNVTWKGRQIDAT
jgi:4,4'-diaponeurosporenoate glycosyltransferase